MTQNSAQYTKVAADSLDRLVRDVRSGRAGWTEHNVYQATGDLIRIADAVATVLQQMAAAVAQTGCPGSEASQARQTMRELGAAGQSVTAAATQLRRIRR